jgi:hypothetical protein
VWLATLVLAAAACDSGGRTRSGRTDTDAGETGRDAGAETEDAAARDSGSVPGDAGPGDSGSAADECADRARWIYLVDSDRTLIRFEPDTLELTEIGELQCDADFGVGPFSMSVDRDARAWVLYRDGTLKHVSTEDASCETTSFEPGQHGFDLFGMGFTTDSDGSQNETLFVSGGSESQIGTGSSTLGAIDDETLELEPIGGLPGWPELTGNADGALWGFFPDTSPPSVRRIDKTDADTPEVFDLDQLASMHTGAWAFAFWGGRFYIFLKRLSDPSTKVWRLDPETGELMEVVENTGYRIVGAGVSTCAPVELI